MEHFIGPQWSKEEEKKLRFKQFPYVFLDISVDGEYKGRLEFELFGDTPLTSENFRCLCTGEKGKGKSGKDLHYKGNVFHRIIPDYLLQGGDIINKNGTGGESIYGYSFADENYTHLHDDSFLLAMANNGEKNSNNSQFYITIKKTP